MWIDPQYPRDALCAGLDPEIFFPVDEDNIDSERVKHAKGICAVCPVRLQCLAHGMGEGFGIWGGLTTVERRRLRTRRRRLAARRQPAA